MTGSMTTVTVVSLFYYTYFPRFENKMFFERYFKKYLG